MLILPSRRNWLHRGIRHSAKQKTEVKETSQIGERERRQKMAVFGSCQVDLNESSGMTRCPFVKFSGQLNLNFPDLRLPIPFFIFHKLSYTLNIHYFSSSCSKSKSTKPLALYLPLLILLLSRKPRQRALYL